MSSVGEVISGAVESFESRHNLLRSAVRMYALRICAGGIEQYGGIFGESTPILDGLVMSPL